MKVIVCGGRRFDDRDRVFAVLDQFDRIEGPITKIIEGGALGADKLARDWAWERNKPSMTYYAKWDKYGRGAGPIRNDNMLQYEQPDYVIAFPGGRGTRNMIEQALDRKVPVIQIRIEENADT